MAFPVLRKLQFFPTKCEVGSFGEGPRHWTQKEVQEFVQDNKRTDVQVLNKIHRGNQFWLFRATPAPQQDEANPNFWHYMTEDGSMHITIAPVRPRARRQVPTERVSAPKKRWVDNRPNTPQPGPTQIDLTQDTNSEISGEKERPPRRQAGKGKGEGKSKVLQQKIDPDKAFQALYPGWSFINHGGNGDCAFRCAAFSLGRIPKKNVVGESLIREASRLWVLATGQLLKFKDKYEPFWAVDPDEEAYMCANAEVPQDYAEYVLTASRQGYYADDLLLTALATRLEIPIIVFAWSHERQSWERSVVANSFVGNTAKVKNKGAGSADINAT